MWSSVVLDSGAGRANWGTGRAPLKVILWHVWNAICYVTCVVSNSRKYPSRQRCGWWHARRRWSKLSSTFTPSWWCSALLAGQSGALAVFLHASFFQIPTEYPSRAKQSALHQDNSQCQASLLDCTWALITMWSLQQHRQVALAAFSTFGKISCLFSNTLFQSLIPAVLMSQTQINHQCKKKVLLQQDSKSTEPSEQHFYWLLSSLFTAQFN